jgi:hypothetical protein
MSKVIIYPQEGGPTVICNPADNCGLSVEEIARKDVPAGVPFRIIDRSELPEDQDLLTKDFSNPDGVGVGHKAWFAERGITI